MRTITNIYSHSFSVEKASFVEVEGSDIHCCLVKVMIIKDIQATTQKT